MMTAAERARRDPEFRALVDWLYYAIVRCPYTHFPPTAVRAAVRLALLRSEQARAPRAGTAAGEG